jgi:hypothetical protein
MVSPRALSTLGVCWSGKESGVTRSWVMTGSWIHAGRAAFEGIIRLGAPALLIAVLAAAGGALAAPGEEDSARGEEISPPSSSPVPEAAPPPPDVDLDRLLRLPTSYTSQAQRHRGATASDWRARFAEADGGLEASRSRLSDAQKKMEHTAADSAQWQMGAPGLGNPDAEHATVSYKLRAEIRTLRDELTQAEKRRKDLTIEADLAGVPDSWRRPEGTPAPPRAGELSESPPDVFDPSQP